MIRNIGWLQILKNFGVGDEKISHVKNRIGQDFRYAIDSSKLRNELGWKPKVDFKEGIKETIEWYKQNPKWWKPLNLLVEENEDIITL